MIKSFTSFILEAKAPAPEEKKGGKNFHLGRAYETATAIELAKRTAAKNNPSQKARNAVMQQFHNESMEHFNPEQRAEILKRGKDSARVYLDKLKSSEGISPEHVSEVHHTYAGIDNLVGKKVSQQDNPHDVMVKTTKKMKYGGNLHGASLKFNPGTLTNNTMNTFDQMMASSGFKTKAKAIWTAKKKKLGIENHTGDQLKEIRDKPFIKKANQEAQNEAGEDHAKAFNSGNVKQKRSFMMNVMKANPAVPYHYVVGAKGGKAEDINEKKQYALARGAKDFHAYHTGNGIVHITDHLGQSVMMFEHRPTHGAFNSIQVNGKLGTGKVPKPVQAMIDAKSKKVKK